MPTHLIYGVHPVMEVLRAGKRRVKSIHYAKSPSKRLEEILSAARGAGVPIKPADARQLDDRARGAVHQGVVAVVESVVTHDLPSFIDRVKASGERPVVVVLDSITDPHNFGAILRCAETFGVAGAIFPKDRSCEINSTVVKTSAGATEYLELCRVTNIARALAQLRDENFYVIAAQSNGRTPLTAFTPKFPLAVVMGSEEKGIRPLVEKNCDETVGIPLYGNIESLNVSAAAAVIFYEISKNVRART